MLVLLAVIGYSFFNECAKNDVYIFFDAEKDKGKINWSDYAYLFPKVNNFEQIMEDSVRVKNLNKKQKNKIDSIINNFYSSPHRYIGLDINGHKKFEIVVDTDVVEIELQILNERKIEEDDLYGLNILSLEAFIQKFSLLRGFNRKEEQYMRFSDNTRFNVIYFDKGNFSVMEVKPIIVYY